jgi:hypothetical protein
MYVSTNGGTTFAAITGQSYGKSGPASIYISPVTGDVVTSNDYGLLLYPPPYRPDGSIITGVPVASDYTGTIFSDLDRYDSYSGPAPAV